MYKIFRSHSQTSRSRRLGSLALVIEQQKQKNSLREKEDREDRTISLGRILGKRGRMQGNHRVLLVVISWRGGIEDVVEGLSNYCDSHKAWGKEKFGNHHKEIKE